ARNDTAEARALRDRIEAAFSERVQENLNLSTEQSTKLRATQERFGARRRTLQQQQMDRRRAIDDQMQPGVAANQDSLRKLLDAQRAGRAELAKIEQDEDQEMAGYLTPVQRARYEQMRGRLMRSTDRVVVVAENDSEAEPVHRETGGHINEGTGTVLAARDLELSKPGA